MDSVKASSYEDSYEENDYGIGDNNGMECFFAIHNKNNSIFFLN